MGRFGSGYSDAYWNRCLNKFLKTRRARKIIGYVIQTVFLWLRTLQQIYAFPSA